MIILKQMLVDILSHVMTMAFSQLSKPVVSLPVCLRPGFLQPFHRPTRYSQR